MRHMRLAFRMTLLAGACGALVAACQTAPAREPAPVYAATPASPAPSPLTVTLPAAADPSAPRVNQWGGEVPETAPAAPVSTGDLPPVRRP
jgi:hypothetical protein